MKNKLLVILFAAVVAFAFAACKNKSDVVDVCDDMIKESMHKSARSLTQLTGETLTITEFEFATTNVNDNKLVCRTISFGNATPLVRVDDPMTYEYGEWNENNTAYSIYVTPSVGAPYTMWYKGNAFILPDGRTIGGDGNDVTARVDKWETVLKTISNTAWEGTFRDKFVMDSIFRDSIRTTYIPPMTFIVDTIKIFTGQMDTLSADTTCYYKFNLARDAANINSGHFYMKSAKTKYDRETGIADTLSIKVEEYDFNWFFSEVASGAKFTIVLKNVVPGVEATDLNISKYKLDSVGAASEFMLNGVTFKQPLLP